MSITGEFFLGLIIALVGIIPPGLLNMTAAKISLKEGHVRGIMFSIGVCVVVWVQTFVAAQFASYISDHPNVVGILQRVAFVIFVLITGYFLLIAKSDPKPDVEHQSRSKHSRFFQGVLMSVINVFPIPYQAYMTVTIASFGWMEFETFPIIAYVTGATLGTFIMLYVYIVFFDKIKDKPWTSQKNMNRIIGGITGLIALVTLFNIIKRL